MASELWQRLREMRKFADKTQLDMAKAVGITRSAYAFWEWDKEDGRRTRPNVDQAQIIAKMCKVPIEWMLDDSSDVSDIWRGFPKQARHPVQTPSPAPAPVAPAPAPNGERMEQRFWSAVEYLVVSGAPKLEGAFARPVQAGVMELAVSFLTERCVALFSRASGEQQLLQDIGHLLIVARALGNRGHGLMILVRGEMTEATQALCESARRFLGVQVAYVTEPEEAASLLLAAQ